MTALDFAPSSAFVYFHMTTSNGGANPLEALLEASGDDDDRELDLAMSIIHDLDVSLLEPQSPTPSSCSASSVDPDGLLFTHSTDFRRAGELRDPTTGVVDTDTLTLSSDDRFAFSLPVSSAAQLSAAAKPKRKEKKCTYQNRRLEIRHLRDEVAALQTRIRKLKLVKSRRRRQESANAGAGSPTRSRSKLETENAELKAAILAQKAQLNSLIDRMQASKLLAPTRGLDGVKEEEEERRRSLNDTTLQWQQR